MNDEAIANVHSPVLVADPEDFYQVSRLWCLIILKEEHTVKKYLCLQLTVLGNNPGRLNLTGLSDFSWGSNKEKTWKVHQNI